MCRTRARRVPRRGGERTAALRASAVGRRRSPRSFCNPDPNLLEGSSPCRSLPPLHPQRYLKTRLSYSSTRPAAGGRIDVCSRVVSRPNSQPRGRQYTPRSHPCPRSCHILNAVAQGKNRGQDQVSGRVRDSASGPAFGTIEHADMPTRACVRSGRARSLWWLETLG